MTRRSGRLASPTATGAPRPSGQSLQQVGDDEREAAAALLKELSDRAAPERAVETEILVGKPARAIAEAVFRRIDRPVTVIR